MKVPSAASPPSSSDRKELSSSRTGALASDASIKPFAGFGSFRQRHGDVLGRTRGRSLDPPAKLEAGPSEEHSLQLESRRPIASASPPLHGNADAVPSPMFIGHDRPSTSSIGPSLRQPRLVLHKQIQRSSSTDLDREEAWERKKGLNSQEGGERADSSDDHGYDGSEEEEEPCFFDDDVASDPGAVAARKFESGSRKKAWQRRREAKRVLRSRARSLADEDLEELRGSIDLGFGFGDEGSSSNLKSTLPALGLYHAINRNYLDSKCRSSPVSPLERTHSAGSTGSPASESWRISSPGDHPNQVKTRLRHWAQAVACSIKQAY